jgi:hypothetical protein
VNGSLSGTLTTVTGGTLGGTGQAAAVILSGGTMAPGATSPALIFGVLSTAGDLTLNSGTVAMKMAGPFNGSYDQINVTGSVNLNGPISLSLDFSFYDPTDDSDSFVILNNDLADPINFATSNARFFYGATQLNEGTIFTATSGTYTQAFQISYVGGDGNDVVLNAVTAVPEPGALGALCAGGAGLLGLARPRQARLA